MRDCMEIRLKWFHLFCWQCKREGFMEHIKEQEGEGCQIYGFLEVNKVAGNFHFAPGKSFQQAGMHVHDLMPFQDMKFNVRGSFLHLRSLNSRLLSYSIGLLAIDDDGPMFVDKHNAMAPYLAGQNAFNLEHGHFSNGNIGLSNNHARRLCCLPSLLRSQMTHKINHLSFGAKFPGIVNPLDGWVELWGEPPLS